MFSRILFFVTCFLAANCADLVIFDGKTGVFDSNWANWSYSSSLVTTKTTVKSGYSYSLSLTAGDYKAFYVHYQAQFTLANFAGLQFWAYGVGTGKSFSAVVIGATNWYTIGQPADLSSYITAGKWTRIQLPWSAFGLGATDTSNGIQIQYTSNGQGTMLFTDIRIATTFTAVESSSSSSDESSSSSSASAGTPATITLTSSMSSSPISSLLFGANFATGAELASMNYSVNRWGGDQASRYAYDVDADNRGSDYYFENIPSTIDDDTQLPFGSSSDMFISSTLQSHSIPLITVPMLGYVPFDRTVRCGFSTDLYGPQQSSDPYLPTCGNGIAVDGVTPIANNPADISNIVDENYALSWLNHIDQAIGTNQVNFFALDNEPGLWHVTHRDVHPTPATYAEIWQKTVAYAGAIKSRYPNSKIYGPVSWGYCDIFFSPADGNCQRGPDRISNGDVPFLQWYIQQIAAYKAANGVQLVDVIDVHAYPTNLAQVNSNAEDAATVALRFAETRSLWDPTYTDSVRKAKINLLPTIQSWIAQYCPGLKLSVSEYSYGGDNIITGALANTMVLGIFANNNVYLASKWQAPVSGSLTELSFKLFTNYDGNGAAVTGYPISIKNSNQNAVEMYAFMDNNTIHLVAVNKQAITTTVAVDYTSYPGFTKASDLTVAGYYFDSTSTAGTLTPFAVDVAAKSLKLKPLSAVVIRVRSSSALANPTPASGPTTAGTQTASLKNASSSVLPSSFAVLFALLLVISNFVF